MSGSEGSSNDAIRTRLEEPESHRASLESEAARASTDPAVTRRGLLGSAAKVAAGVAALGAVGVVDATNASANDGGAVLLGQAVNTATKKTGVQCSGSGPAFGANSTGGGHGLDSTTKGATKAAVHAHHEGDASNGGYGVYSTALHGVGVYAESSNGHAIETKAVGENQIGVYGYHAGTTGVGGFGMYAESAKYIALYAVSHANDAIVATAIAGGHSAVAGTHTGNGHAVNAQAISTTSTTAAVLAQHAGGGPGVRGTSAKGVGGSFQGARAAINLAAQSGAGRPTTGAHVIGDVVVDSAGTLFLCTGSGTPGTWVTVNVTPA